MPTCEIGRSKSALCPKIATTATAIENAAKLSIATMPIILEKASNPGKERKFTDALNTTAALQRQWSILLAKGESVCIRRATRPMTSVGAAYQRPLSSSISLVGRRACSYNMWRIRRRDWLEPTLVGSGLLGRK